MAQQDDYIRTALRVPPDLHGSLHTAATTANRTFNAEIIHRLQQSFQATETTPTFSAEVMVAVREEMDARGGTFTEALTRLVLAGHSEGGTLFTVKAARNTTYATILEAIRASETVIPANAKLLLARDRLPPEVPSTDEKNRAQGPA